MVAAPGLAPVTRAAGNRFAGDGEAPRAYVAHSLVETAIGRDVLTPRPVAKPALLRQVFALAADHPAKIVSYTKMLRALHDAETQDPDRVSA